MDKVLIDDVNEMVGIFIFCTKGAVMLYQKYPGKSLRHIIGGPFIWAPLLFALILDLFVEMYQYVCFPLYGLEKVNRRDYISIWDRPRLKYLNWYQKLRCAYCGYMNGVFAYWGEIAHRTEGYRCGIIHQENNLKGHEYQHAHEFTPFDDEQAFTQKYKSK